MTVAKPKLLEARRLLLDRLDAHPGRTVPADLDPAEVGIVGDEDHRGGYHVGRDRLDPDDDYSVVESARDRRGLAAHPDWASAEDIGWFEVEIGGRTHNLRTFSRWLVKQCEAGAPDTADIREVIWSPDGVRVQRWDRLRRRTSGDSSHRTHTHISEHRDADGSRMVALFRRYITEVLEDDMSLTDDDLRKIGRTVATWDYRNGEPVEEAYKVALRAADNAQSARSLAQQAVDLIRAVQQRVDELAGRPLVDVATLAAQLTPGLVEALGDVLPAEQAQAIADLVVSRLAAGVRAQADALTAAGS